MTSHNQLSKAHVPQFVNNKPWHQKMSRKKWTSLDKALSPPIIEVIKGFKFDLMTPVQVNNHYSIRKYHKVSKS